jgi:hypothetical protein
MYPEKPNRFWLVSGLLLAIIFTVAFRTGELVELDAYLNQESNSSIIKVSQNVQFIVPKGTNANVLSAHRLRSGNYALELQVIGNASDGKGAGQKVWVLFRDSNSAMASASSVTLDGSPLAAHLAKFTHDTPAIAQWVNPINQSVALSAQNQGPPVTVDTHDLVQQQKAQATQDAQAALWEKSMPINSIQGRGLASEKANEGL